MSRPSRDVTKAIAGKSSCGVSYIASLTVGQFAPYSHSSDQVFNGLGFRCPHKLAGYTLWFPVVKSKAVAFSE